MIKNSFKFITVASLAVSTAAVFAGGDNAPYNNSSIDARLNVTVKPDTDVVHFVRDNATPNVVTKTYVLKHADPYELRAYIRNMVQTRSVNSKNTNVKAIKYTDGTSILLIAAEEYRFADSVKGQGFDTIVKLLDKPGITASSGRPTYVYAPKFCKASELMEMVKRIGANYNNGSALAEENDIGATDALAVDDSLNLMFFKTAPFSRQSILNVLSEYDRRIQEVKAKITVYEIYAENDTKLGLDFQAWKNNDGIDLLSTGGRFMHNYAPDNSGLMKNGKWSDTQYFNFNPKWNTKYVDFLTSTGKAKVLHSCEMVLSSGKTGTVERTTQVFLAQERKKTDENGNEINRDKTVHNDYSEIPVSALAQGQIIGYTQKKEPITFISSPRATLSALLQEVNGAGRYTLRLSDGHFRVRGRFYGKKVYASSINFENTLSNVSSDVVMQRGKQISAEVSGGLDEATKLYGFKLKMVPIVSKEATILDVTVSNSSLIGYEASGAPRISKEATVSSKFMISKAGTKLVIGGIEKRDVVSVSGGVPLLKDLPVIGWIFSTESESTKRSQLLVVAEVLPVNAGDTFSAEEKQEMKKLDKKLDKAGKSNTYGYRQWLIDPDR